MFALAVLLSMSVFDSAPQAGSPPGHFTLHVGGTVQDNLTGLLWERWATTKRMSSAEAQAYCDGLSLLGRTWRVPSVTELLTIVDLSAPGDVKIDANFFAATQDWRYQTWPPSGHDDNVWVIWFGDGAITWSDPKSEMNVRCVTAEGRREAAR